MGAFAYELPHSTHSIYYTYQTNKESGPTPFAIGLMLRAICAADSAWTATQRLVLTVIALHTNARTGECWPSLATICAETGLGRTAVCDALNAIEAGEGPLVLERIRRISSNGDPTSTLYRLAWASQTPTRDSSTNHERPVVQQADQGSAPGGLGSAPGEHKLLINSKPKLNPPPPPKAKRLGPLHPLVCVQRGGEVDEILKEFCFLAHGVPQDQALPHIPREDQQLAQEWVETYGLGKAKWMVGDCVRQHNDLGRDTMRLFRGLTMYESIALGAYEKEQAKAKANPSPVRRNEPRDMNPAQIGRPISEFRSDMAEMRDAVALVLKELQ